MSGNPLNGLFDLLFNFWVGFTVLVLILLRYSFRLVPQNRAFVVERFLSKGNLSGALK